MSNKIICEHAMLPPPMAPRSYRVPEIRIMMVRESMRLVPKFGNSLHVYNALKEIVTYSDREHFLVICLDTKHKPLAINIATTGTIDSSLIHPREIFKPAILCGASSIVVAHNHPSGDPLPSINDQKVTAQTLEASKILAIPLLDHIIIGDETYYSFRDSGLLSSSL